MLFKVNSHRISYIFSVRKSVTSDINYAMNIAIRVVEHSLIIQVMLFKFFYVDIVEGKRKKK